MNKKIILQKFIASSGFCSRRKAEELIRVGNVMVNNKTAELGQSVSIDDEVKIGDEKIELKNNKIYIKLNKPEEYVCTNRSFKDEKNIFDIVDVKERLFCVGRLDKNSRGLVLLTNDGELTQKLTHPKFEHKKIYEVKVDGKLASKDIKNIIDNLEKGIDIGDGDGLVKAESIKFLENNIFLIILTGGKKRQIRRMFKEVGFRVKDLKRTGIESLSLGNLKEGEWKDLSEEEIKGLLNS